MTRSEAVRFVDLSSGFVSDPNDVGLLSLLRPFRPDYKAAIGKLLESLVTLHAGMRESKLDRKFCASLWYICEGARTLVLRPNSSVRVNGLATDTQLTHLALWVDAIEIFSIRWLQGLDLGCCLSHAVELVAQGRMNRPDHFRFLLRVLPELTRDEDEDLREYAEQAMRVLSL